MEASDPRLLNGIEINEHGLQILSARLLKEDGSLLEAGNPVDVGEIIYCQLFIAGWHVEHGIVKPGASEIIQTKEKEIILGEEDLFKSVTGASEEDARVVTLRAGITNITNSATEFEVIFRVWDKVSKAELSGSFTFHLR